MRGLIITVLVILGLLAAALAVGYAVLRRPDIPYATLEAQYAGPEDQFITLPDGVRMRFRDTGDADLPTLLMVHGFSASLETWEPWVAELSGEYRMVRVDLPGHGMTQQPAGYRGAIEPFRDAVEAFTAAHGLDRFTIIGSSMGGNVAWEYALTRPEQIEALVLVAAGGWPETREEVAEEPPVFTLLRNPVLGPALRDIDTTRLVRQGLEASFVNIDLVTDEMVSRYVDFSRAPGHRQILLDITLGFRSRNFATNERLAPLADIPVLILHGTPDRLVPVEHGRAFAEAIPGSEIVVWDDVGHVVQEDDPPRTAAALRSFLQTRVYPAPAAPAEPTDAIAPAPQPALVP